VRSFPQAGIGESRNQLVDSEARIGPGWQQSRQNRSAQHLWREWRNRKWDAKFLIHANRVSSGSCAGLSESTLFREGIGVERSVLQARLIRMTPDFFVYRASFYKA